MSTRSPRLYRGLLWLLPAAVRRERGDDMVEAFLACRDRERRRLGIAGLGHAWIRSTVDVIIAAIIIRLDTRRARRITAFTRTSPSGDHVMNQIWIDLRYAARRMRQAPLFSTAIVLTLALAIGATTAIFSVVDAVLLRGLPYPQADRLVMVYLGWKAAPRPMGFSPPDYLAFEERATAFAEMAAFRNREYELSGVRQPERIVAARVSASLFETLGVPPLHGRAFTREEDQGQQPVAVLSDKLWRRVFGGDTAAIGRAVILDR